MHMYISSEKHECESKVVFGVSSDLVGKKEMPVENYPHMVVRVNPVAVMNSSETNVQEMLQPFSEVDDIGSQSSPFVHNMNVERDAELCKVHVPEISVACSNPIEDGGHSLGDGSSEDDQALNDTPTTVTTALSASTSTTASFEIGIPNDDNACSVQISLEQQSQISKLHASSQPDSTINTDTGPNPSYQGSSNTHTGKVAHDESEDLPLNDDTDSKKNVSGSYVNNGSGFLPTQKIDQSAVGTTEYGTVHVIALDILNDIIYAVIQKCHEHIPLDDHEPELALPRSDNLTPCVSTPEPDDFNRQDHRVPRKAVTNRSCPTVDLVAAANSSVLVVASAAGTPDEHTVHKAVAGSPLTPKSGTDFGHRESSPLASEEDKGVVETKGIEVAVGNGGEASTASARESKSSIMGMSPPYSETDSESESSGSDGYEQDASETESEETISQTPQDVATIEVGYVLEESAPDQSLSEPDVCKQDTLATVHAHHRTTPSVFTE